MKQQIRLTESELHRLITEAVMEYMDEDAEQWGSKAGGWLGRQVDRAGRGIQQGAQAVGRGVQQGAQAVGQAGQWVGRQAQQGAQAVGRGVQQGAQAVKKGAQAVGQGVQNWAQLNQRVSRIEKQLGLAESKQRFIDDIVNEAINRYIR